MSQNKADSGRETGARKKNAKNKKVQICTDKCITGTEPKDTCAGRETNFLGRANYNVSIKRRNASRPSAVHL